MLILNIDLSILILLTLKISFDSIILFNAICVDVDQFQVLD